MNKRLIPHAAGGPLALLAFVVAVAVAAEKPDPSSAEDKPAFDPVKQNIEGWTVWVDPSLLPGGEHAGKGEDALEMLANHLQRVQILVPEKSLEKLRTCEIWIENEHPELSSMQYHPSGDWLKKNGYDPRLEKKVHLPRASALLSRQQMLKHPAVVLHELAHAYHDQILGFDEPQIMGAYREAMAKGIYEKVLLFSGGTVRHYAATNHKEYFAEATEAYFYRNDFYPFVSAELKEHDPRVFAVMEKVWGKP